MEFAFVLRRRTNATTAIRKQFEAQMALFALVVFESHSNFDLLTKLAICQTASFIFSF